MALPELGFFLKEERGWGSPKSPQRLMTPAHLECEREMHVQQDELQKAAPVFPSLIILVLNRILTLIRFSQPWRGQAFRTSRQFCFPLRTAG